LPGQLRQGICLTADQRLFIKKFFSLKFCHHLWLACKSLVRPYLSKSFVLFWQSHQGIPIVFVIMLLTAFFFEFHVFQDLRLPAFWFVGWDLWILLLCVPIGLIQIFRFVVVDSLLVNCRLVEIDMLVVFVHRQVHEQTHQTALCFILPLGLNHAAISPFGQDFWVPSLKWFSFYHLLRGLWEFMFFSFHLAPMVFINFNSPLIYLLLHLNHSNQSIAPIYLKIY
jgi:hypothetical protein